MHTTGNIIAALVIAASSTAALGSVELQIDVNSLTTSVMNNPVLDAMDSASTSSDSGVYTRGSGFSTNYTGSISMADDVTSTLAAILINGVNQGATGSLHDFTGQIDFVNGTVNGGTFTVTVLESDAVTVNTYTAHIMQGVGQITTQAGQGFKIDGLTYAGMFSSSTFAGVDVTAWDNAEPLFGSLIHFKFNPNASGVDNDADIDIFVVVPLPAAPALAGVGLLGLAGVSRRRRLA